VTFPDQGFASELLSDLVGSFIGVYAAFKIEDRRQAGERTEAGRDRDHARQLREKAEVDERESHETAPRVA
jgi:hypothetical protein